MYYFFYCHLPTCKLLKNQSLHVILSSPLCFQPWVKSELSSHLFLLVLTWSVVKTCPFRLGVEPLKDALFFNVNTSVAPHCILCTVRGTQNPSQSPRFYLLLFPTQHSNNPATPAAWLCGKHTRYFTVCMLVCLMPSPNTSLFSQEISLSCQGSHWFFPLSLGRQEVESHPWVLPCPFPHSGQHFHTVMCYICHFSWMMNLSSLTPVFHLERLAGDGSHGTGFGITRSGLESKLCRLLAV